MSVSAPSVTHKPAKIRPEHQALRWTRCLRGPSGYGGYHRTLQLEELGREAKLGIIDIDVYPEGLGERWANYSAGFLHWLAGQQHPLCSLADLWESGRHLRIMQDALGNSSSGILLWEDVADTAPCYSARKAGLAVVALPHNLEAFYRGKEAGGTVPGQLRKLSAEATALAAADKVFCISREEQWLLRLLEIEADYLPYFPPRALMPRLAAVRKMRASSEKKAFLIVGTAANPYTFEGMRDLIEWLAASDEHRDTPIVVAGRGTEKLSALTRRPNFSFRGAVSDDELDELLAEARALLISQKAGTGTLTRIPECLVAGVPILADEMSARSCLHFEGVRTYRSFADLDELMAESIPDPAVPGRPAEEALFVSYLEQLLH